MSNVQLRSSSNVQLAQSDVMPAISELDTLLRHMEPVLNAGSYVYAMHKAHVPLDNPRVVATVREPEGLSLLVEEAFAREHGLDAVFRCAWITLRVHSDLAAVGLTAAFARALSDAGISCNVVAGLHHDHIFVPEANAASAMATLTALQEGIPPHDNGGDDQRLFGGLFDAAIRNAASSRCAEGFHARTT